MNVVTECVFMSGNVIMFGMSFANFDSVTLKGTFFIFACVNSFSERSMSFTLYSFATRSHLFTLQPVFHDWNAAARPSPMYISPAWSCMVSITAPRTHGDVHMPGRRKSAQHMFTLRRVSSPL